MKIYDEFGNFVGYIKTNALSGRGLLALGLFLVFLTFVPGAISFVPGFLIILIVPTIFLGIPWMMTKRLQGTPRIIASVLLVFLACLILSILMQAYAPALQKLLTALVCTLGNVSDSCPK